MMLPKITVITPVFNTEEIIETVLSSVANQTYQNIEHVIVDGASTDKTLTAIRKFQKTHRNVRLLTGKDEGIYDAMNKGLDICTGDWVLFMGADDTFYDNDTLTDLFEQGLFLEEQVVYGNVMIKGDTIWAKDKSIYDGPFTLDKLFRWNICHQSIIYPRSVIKQVGYFNPKYRVTADWDYNIRCWARYRFTYADRVIAVFQTGGKSSGGGDDEFQRDLPENVIKYFHLDINNYDLHAAASPFYWVMALHREGEYLDKIALLQSETESRRQHIAEMELQIERIKTEFETNIAGLKTGHEQFVTDLRAEHETTISGLKTGHEQVVAALRHELEEKLAGLQSEHLHNISSLEKEYSQVISGLKEEHDHIISGLKEEHAQAIELLLKDHQQSVNDLRNEQIRMVDQLKTEQNQYVSALKADQVKTIDILRDGFEAIQTKQEAELLDLRDLLLKKEEEYNRSIGELKATQAGKDLQYLQAAEKAGKEIAALSDEISSLRKELQAHKQVIDSMVSSYTWKTGRILLSPFRLLLGK